MDGAIAQFLFAVAFSKPGSDSFSIGVAAVVMVPHAEGGTGAGGSIRHPGAGRVVCHGRAVRMSPGLVMTRTGGRAGPEGCWQYRPAGRLHRDHCAQGRKTKVLSASGRRKAKTMARTSASL
jgi:hypothetical protein